jgi:hypothetical protein
MKWLKAKGKTEVFKFPYKIGDKVNVVDEETKKKKGSGVVEEFLGWGEPEGEPGAIEQMVGVKMDDGKRKAFFWYELEKV